MSGYINGRGPKNVKNKMKGWNEEDAEAGRFHHAGFGNYYTYSKKENIQMNLFVAVVFIVFFVLPYIVVNSI